VLIFAFFFPALNTAAGVRHASRSLLDTARVFHMSRWRTATRVLLPGAGPFVVAGIRLGFGMAVKGMVIAEIWVTLGTGAIMHEAADSRQLGLFFAMALLILVFAAGVSELLSALERFMRRDLTLARRA
jgi:ABC-type nitrate/sulfonate/bicarbonate transport system permease component